jgi:hypothetical protein
MYVMPCVPTPVDRHLSDLQHGVYGGRRGVGVHAVLHHVPSQVGARHGQQVPGMLRGHRRPDTRATRSRSWQVVSKDKIIDRCTYLPNTTYTDLYSHMTG